MSAIGVLENSSLLLSLLSLAILIILIVNNFSLYRNKLKDDVSILIIATILLNLSELSFFLVTDETSLIVGILIFLGFHAAVIFTLNSFQRVVFFNMEILFPRKWMNNICGIFLGGIVLILCVVHYFEPCLFFQEEGTITYGWGGVLVRVLEYLVIIVNVVSSLAYYLSKRKKDREKAAVGADFFWFSVIILVLYSIETLLMISAYYAELSLAVSVALVYLLSKLNVKTLVKLETDEATLKADFALACKIQTDSLPKNSPPFEHHPEIVLDYFIKPAKDVGGDFYDFFEVDDTHICFLIADVVGKGIPAALFMMKAKTAIRIASESEKGTDRILARANRILQQENDAMMFVTVWIGILDTDTFVLEYTSAGHNSPFISRAGGNFNLMPPTEDTLLGVMEEVGFSRERLKLFPGDRLILYTDGLTEAQNSRKEMLGEAGALESLNSPENPGTASPVNTLVSCVEAFADGAEQFDDITVLSLTIPKGGIGMQEDFEFVF